MEILSAEEIEEFRRLIDYFANFTGPSDDEELSLEDAEAEAYLAELTGKLEAWKIDYYGEEDASTISTEDALYAMEVEGQWRNSLLTPDEAKRLDDYWNATEPLTDDEKADEEALRLRLYDYMHFAKYWMYTP